MNRRLGIHKSVTTVLNSEGQIMIPLSICKKLGVVEGDRIEFVEMGNGVFSIIALTEDITSLKGIISKPKIPVSIDQINKTIGRRRSGK